MVNAYHSGKQENKTSDQQVKVVSAGTDRMDGEQDHNEGYEALKTEVMENS